MARGHTAGNASLLDAQLADPCGKPEDGKSDDVGKQGHFVKSTQEHKDKHWSRPTSSAIKEASKLFTTSTIIMSQDLSSTENKIMTAKQKKDTADQAFMSGQLKDGATACSLIAAV